MKNRIKAVLCSTTILMSLVAVSNAQEQAADGVLNSGKRHGIESVINSDGQKNTESILDNHQSIERISGSDRYQTSVSVSQSSYKTSKNIIIASGESFADALSGGQLSKSFDAPMLLSKKESISPSVLHEIKRLKANTVYIMGGENTISKSVEKHIKQVAPNVSRVSGSNRYETSQIAANIAKKNGQAGATIISNGENFADALSGGCIVGNTDSNMVLTHSKSKMKGDENCVILGGNKSVPATVMGNRISGSDRYETSLNIAKKYFPNPKTVILVSGENYPDALSAVIKSKQHNAPIVLAKRYSMDPKTQEYVKNADKVVVVGGEGTLSDIVLYKMMPNTMVINKTVGSDGSLSVSNKVLDLSNIDSMIDSKINDKIKELGVFSDYAIVYIDYGYTVASKIVKKGDEIIFTKINPYEEDFEGRHYEHIVNGKKVSTKSCKITKNTLIEIRQIKVDDEFIRNFKPEPGEHKVVMELPSGEKRVLSTKNKRIKGIIDSGISLYIKDSGKPVLFDNDNGYMSVDVFDKDVILVGKYTSYNPEEAEKNIKFVFKHNDKVLFEKNTTKKRTSDVIRSFKKQPYSRQSFVRGWYVEGTNISIDDLEYMGIDNFMELKDKDTIIIKSKPYTKRVTIQGSGLRREYFYEGDIINPSEIAEKKGINLYKNGFYLTYTDRDGEVTLKIDGKTVRLDEKYFKYRSDIRIEDAKKAYVVNLIFGYVSEDGTFKILSNKKREYRRETVDVELDLDADHVDYYLSGDARRIMKELKFNKDDVIPYEFTICDNTLHSIDDEEIINKVKNGEDIYIKMNVYKERNIQDDVGTNHILYIDDVNKVLVKSGEIDGSESDVNSILAKIGSLGIKKIGFNDGYPNYDVTNITSDRDVIPEGVERIDNLKVNTKELVLPRSLKAIGSKAITGNIEKLVINSTDLTIGSYAFSNVGLKGKLVIPKGVKTIYDDAFPGNDISVIEVEDDSNYSLNWNKNIFSRYPITKLN